MGTKKHDQSAAAADTDSEMEFDSDGLDPEPLPEGHDTLFTFGQHRGCTYGEIVKTQPGYYIWGLGEKTPSKLLKDFIAWVQKHYVLEMGQLYLRSTRSAAAASSTAVPAGRKRQSKLDSLEKKPEPCKGGCDPSTCTRAGSSANYVQITCYKCGHRTKTAREKPQPKFDTAKCKHAGVKDNRGSNKATHKVFCHDCQNAARGMEEETADCIGSCGKPFQCA